MMLSQVRSALHWTVDSYALFVAFGLVIGVLLAPIAIGMVAGPDGKVAIVPIDGTIDGEQSVEASAMLQEARADSSVEAVVLVANSGGGAAAPSEELYIQVKRTSEEMPVVTAVDGGAASGAYYLIAPSDHIYAKPSSNVGSVGVFAQLPPDLEPNELVGATGPRKVGTDQRETLHRLEMLQRAFSGAVMKHREDELELTQEELAHGETYIGAEAVEHGLVDDIGGREAAIEHAADLAGLDRPGVEVFRPGVETNQFVMRGNYLSSSAEDKEMLSLLDLVDDEHSSPTYLMVSAEVASTQDEVAIAGTHGERELETAAESETETDGAAGATPSIVGGELP